MLYSGHATKIFVKESKLAGRYVAERIVQDRFTVRLRAAPQGRLLQPDLPVGQRNQLVPRTPPRTVCFAADRKTCTCGDATALGIPCRHIIAVARACSLSDFLPECFHVHWKRATNVRKTMDGILAARVAPRVLATAGIADDEDAAAYAYDEAIAADAADNHEGMETELVTSQNVTSQTVRRATPRNRFNMLQTQANGLFNVLRENAEKSEVFLAVLQAATRMATHVRGEPTFVVAARHFNSLFSVGTPEDDADDLFPDDGFVANPPGRGPAGRRRTRRLVSVVEGNGASSSAQCGACGCQGHRSNTCPVERNLGTLLTAATWGQLNDHKTEVRDACVCV